MASADATTTTKLPLVLCRSLSRDRDGRYDCAARFYLSFLLDRLLPDAVLPLVLKAFAPERSLAWQFDHRVNWDQPLNGTWLARI